MVNGTKPLLLDSQAEDNVLSSLLSKLAPFSPPSEKASKKPPTPAPSLDGPPKGVEGLQGEWHMFEWVQGGEGQGVDCFGAFQSTEAATGCMQPFFDADFSLGSSSDSSDRAKNNWRQRSRRGRSKKRSTASNKRAKPDKTDIDPFTLTDFVPIEPCDQSEDNSAFKTLINTPFDSDEGSALSALYSGSFTTCIEQPSTSPKKVKKFRAKRGFVPIDPCDQSKDKKSRGKTKKSKGKIKKPKTGCDVCSRCLMEGCGKGHEHKTVMLQLDDDEIPIDEEIAEMIQLVWDLDMMTSMSCQDNIPTGFIWIEFPCHDCYSRFLELLPRAVTKDSWITGEFLGSLRDEDDELIDHTFYSVRFPSDDKDAVVARLKMLLS